MIAVGSPRWIAACLAMGLAAPLWAQDEGTTSGTPEPMTAETAAELPATPAIDAGTVPESTSTGVVPPDTGMTAAGAARTASTAPEAITATVTDQASAQPASVPPPEPQVAILEVMVNDRRAGQFFAQIFADGNVRVESGLLAAARITREHLPPVATDGFVSLNDIATGVTFTVDTDSARMHVRVDPAWLERQQIAATRDKDKDIPSVAVEPGSGFLNYGLVASHSHATDTWSLPWDFGIHHRQYLFTSEFRCQSDTDHQVRLQSRLTREWKDRRQRLTVGDIAPRAYGTGGAGLMGGLAFEKIHEMAPEEKKNAGLATTITLDRPSTVEILQDGRSLRKMALDPGIVELDNILDATGTGMVSIEITDITGARRVIEVPYYISNSVLKPGLQEYGYYLGQIRENLGVTSNDYGSDIVFVGGHRYGLTPTLTLGGQWQASEETQNAGPMLNATLAGMSEIATLLAFSRSGDVNGYGGRLDGTAHLGDEFQVAASIEGFSRDYATLTLMPTDDKVRGGLRANLSWSPGEKIGSFNAGAAVRDYWASAELRSYSLAYRRKIGSSLHATISANINEGDDDSATAYLLYSPPRNRARIASVTLAHVQPDSEDGTQTLDVRSRFPRSRGGWYNARLQQGSPEDSLQLGGGTHTPVGTAMLNATLGGAAESVTASFSGGLAFTRAGVHPSRAISDSFAVVTTGLPNIPVKTSNNGEPQGNTDRKGRLVIPDLASYYTSSVSIEAGSIPITHTLTGNASSLRIGNEGRRWGALVNFDIRSFSAVEGYLFANQADGARKALENTVIRVGDQGGIESVTGDKGYFYLENLGAGSHVLTATSAGGSCRATLVIPKKTDGEQLIQNLGDVLCAP